MKTTNCRPLLVLALLLVPCSLKADILTEIPIDGEYLLLEYITGSGSSISYHVIDFAHTSGDTFAFGYRYDGATMTAHDALLALDAAGDLEYNFSIGWGEPFTDNFSYLLEAGSQANYWSYSLGTHDALAEDVSWSMSPSGAGGQLLQDGSWHGWYNGFTPEYGSINPSIPHGQAVPEPASVVVAGLGLLFLLSWRLGRTRLFVRMM